MRTMARCDPGQRMEENWKLGCVLHANRFDRHPALKGLGTNLLRINESRKGNVKGGILNKRIQNGQDIRGNGGETRLVEFGEVR